MAWSSPITTFAVHDVLTAAEMNAIGSNLNFLHNGVLAQQTLTANTAAANVETVIASIAFTADGVTSIELDFSFLQLPRTVATDVFEVGIWDGPTAGSGTQLCAFQTSNASGTSGGGGMTRRIITPTAGGHTYTVRILRLSGTGNGNINASSTKPATFAIHMAS